MMTCLFMTGCSNHTTLETEILEPMTSDITDITLITASDMHYFSSSLNTNNELFLDALATGDGKVTMYIDEIMDAFIDTVEKEQPEAVILTGDLTLNGELQSHKDLAEKLKQIENNGIPVLVLPGNHDINNSHAIAYTEDGYEQVETVTAQQFQSIYQNYGFDEAISLDTDSLSYTYMSNDAYIALMLDANGTGSASYLTISDTTLKWMENQLKQAQDTGRTVLAFCHENFLNHAEIFSSGYQLNNADEVLALFHKYNVQAGFSGHLHMQSILTDGKFTEAATSSIAITENHYATIQATKDEIVYQTHNLDVSSWAQLQEIENEELLNFDTFTAQYFDDTMTDQLSYTNPGLISYVQMLNRAYFTGHMDTIERNAKYDSILSQNTDFMSIYLTQYVLSETEDKNTFTVKKED